MALISDNIFIGSDEKIFIGTDRYDTTTEPTYVGILTHPNAAAQDYFGQSVAVGSGRIVVGVPNKDVGSNANQGAAYIFDLDGNQLGIITASDGAQYNYFGRSVAVGCGRIFVGSTGSGAYIYDLNGNEVGIITASDGAASDNFGNSVAVGSGRIVVGANSDDHNGYSSGSAYIFDLDGNQLEKIPDLGAAYAYFGSSVAVGNGRIVVGAYGDDGFSGSAYIYDLNGNDVDIITASDGTAYDYFGQSVAVGSGRIVVGVPNKDVGSNSRQGAVYIYDLDGNNEVKIIASDGAAYDQFGSSVAVGNGRIVVGAFEDRESHDGSSLGSVYIFDLDRNQLAKITDTDPAINDWFGWSVAVGSGRIVVGAYGEILTNDYGSAHIFSTPESDHILDILDK